MKLRLDAFMTWLIVLAVAGCPQISDEMLPLGMNLLDTSEEATGDPDASDDANRRQKVAAWLLADNDNDGLPNGLELEFGLDHENPADGLDIDGDGNFNFRDDDVDGDGILNSTDPDVDGDGLFNLIDADIDGDAIPDDSDFDMDGDGVRNEWDWDDDSNGQDDTDDDEDVLGQLEDEELRFSAAVQALKDRIVAAEELEDVKLREKALTQYRSDLRDLLAQVSKVKHERRPIALDSTEVQLIARSLASRFKWGGSKTLEFDIKTAISQLTPLHGEPQPGDDAMTFTDPDPTDAIDAVFRQATGIRDPRRAEAAAELQQRLDALVTLKTRLRQKEVTPVDCSDAVSRLVAMPGEGKPLDKVEGLTRLWDAVEAPQLNALVADLNEMSRSLASRNDTWTWDTMIDALTQLEAMPGTGTLKEKFESLMRIWDAVGEPKLDKLVAGLGKLTQALESRIEGPWGWDVMIEALEGAPGIENGIGSEQIDHTVEEVAEVEGQ